MKKHLPAARHSAFYWNTGEPSIFRALQTSADIRAASTRKVEQARAEGTDWSTLHGISKKSDAQIRERRRYSAPVEGAAAGQRSRDKHAALRRSKI